MIYTFFDRKTKGATTLANKSAIKSIPQNKQHMNFINPLLEDLKKEKYVRHSKTIPGLQI